jgi:hypothetical protein
MKKAIILASLFGLLIPGAAFAGPSTDAALGLGAFAVFNQMIAGTGIFGVFAPPVPRAVIVPPPVAPVFVPAPVIAPPPVIVHEYRPVYVQPPVYYAPPVHRIYHAPARTVVIEKRVVVPPGHAFKGRPGHGRNW